MYQYLQSSSGPLAVDDNISWQDFSARFVGASAIAAFESPHLSTSFLILLFFAFSYADKQMKLLNMEKKFRSFIDDDREREGRCELVFAVHCRSSRPCTLRWRLKSCRSTANSSNDAITCVVFQIVSTMVYSGTGGGSGQELYRRIPGRGANDAQVLGSRPAPAVLHSTHWSWSGRGELELIIRPREHKRQGTREGQRCGGRCEGRVCHRHLRLRLRAPESERTCRRRYG